MTRKKGLSMKNKGKVYKRKFIKKEKKKEFSVADSLKSKDIYEF